MPDQRATAGGQERDLTPAEFFGWLGRLWQLYQDDLAKAEERVCEDSKADE